MTDRTKELKAAIVISLQVHPEQWNYLPNKYGGLLLKGLFIVYENGRVYYDGERIKKDKDIAEAAHLIADFIPNGDFDFEYHLEMLKALE